MLFAPGPVEMEKSICEIAARPSLPYFRGSQFAETVRSVSDDVKYLFQTASLPLPITASGTGLMEMAVSNLLETGDSAIVINGGAFGQKWVEICETYGVRVIQLKTRLGKSPDMDAFLEMLKAGADAVLVNMHETSTGFLYDIQQFGSLVRATGALFIVDGVSAIGADPFEMDAWSVDCAMVSTQKALALLPGLGYIAFSDKALDRMSRVKRARYYFNAPAYLSNMVRGMTPFTPAMASIFQIEARMKQIKRMGLDQWIARHADLAKAFRACIFGISGEFAMFPERSSNALTAVRLPADIAAGDLIEFMRERHDWWFAPAPTAEKDRYLRVSHMGNVNQDLMDLAANRIYEAVQCFRAGGKVS
jgi:aspartate aminotransferase-like enzyme